MRIKLTLVVVILVVLVLPVLSSWIGTPIPGLVTAAYGALPNGSRMPALIGGPDLWINTGGKVLQPRKGVVYLVDFWEYTCVNCIRTDPYLRAWYERYAPYGLVIVGIQTPEFGFSAETKNVAGAAKRDELKYPILNDPESRNWKAFHENYWPSKYLFDQDGKLVYQHAGEGSYQETEQVIQKLLRRSHPDAKFPAPLAPVRPGDVPGAACRGETPELYVNPSYGFLANLPPGWKMDRAAVFVDHGGHADGKIVANGSFITRYQSLQHARTTENLRDYVAIAFHASEVNVVINRPDDRDYKVYATLDGKPVPTKDKGDDIRYDSRGSYIPVDAPRMFNVYRGRFATGDLKLMSDSPDFDIYSYTFSGCPQR
jgi:thiol-disulfide isomerase/thioredoxin